MNQIPSPDVLERALLDILRSTDFIGYVACALVLLTFCMQTMVPLRLVALMSNFAFISYAWVTRLFPILILHCLLALINLVSLSKTLSAPETAKVDRDFVAPDAERHNRRGANNHLRQSITS
jgi:hypothetical protein